MRMLLAVAFFSYLMPSVVRAADWSNVAIPEFWRQIPDGDQSPGKGYSWYRALVRIPADWDGEDLTLFVEALDDARRILVFAAICALHPRHATSVFVFTGTFLW